MRLKTQFMRKLIGYTSSVLLFLSVLLFIKCSKDGGIVLLSLKQEKALGLQTDSVIRADPAEFPVLDRSSNQYVYSYFEDMLASILASDEINYRSEFDWSITIIDKDVMNAFAVPGGKIYFYTGLIKYLENSAQIAGVLSHEIAHVDRRHSNKQLTKAYGLDLIVSLLVDEDNSKLAQIASDMALGVAQLQFSQAHEYEADEYSIKYLLGTEYFPKGIEGFFVKLLDEGKTSSTFEFLSTHPSDQNRIDNINEIWVKNGSQDGEIFIDAYNTLIEAL